MIKCFMFKRECLFGIDMKNEANREKIKNCIINCKKINKNKTNYSKTTFSKFTFFFFGMDCRHPEIIK